MIVVLGILAAIVVPNISSWQKEADNARTIADVRNLQTSVDMYAVKNQNQPPTYYPAALGNPAPIDMDIIHPDYVRNLPRGKEMKYWMDYTGTVWASPIDAPEEVSYQAGELTWKAIEEAALYRIYATAPVSLSGSMKSVSKLHLVKEVTESTVTLPALSEGEEYLVSAVDENGFETPAATRSYKGYQVEGYVESAPSSEAPAEPEITLPPASLQMQGYRSPEGTTLWASGYYGSNTPDKTIDGDLNTVWNSGSHSGVIEYRFPKGEFVKGIQVAAHSGPADNREYVVYGLKDGQWLKIGTGVRYITSGTTIIEPIVVAPYTYDGIKLEMTPNASWVAINEVTIIK